MRSKTDLAAGFMLPKHRSSKIKKNDANANAKNDDAKTDAAKKEEKFVAAAAYRRREEGGERLAVYLPPDIAEALRIAAVRARRSLSDAVTAAVVLWLQGQKH
jgi:hypothetical protein